MFGKRVHKAVLEFGAKVTGITIHFVDEEYDHGPIIFQEPVKISDNEDVNSLSTRVLMVEHEIYWKVIEALIQKTIYIEGRRVYGTI